MKKCLAILLLMFFISGSIYGVIIERIVCTINEEMISWSEFYEYWQFYKLSHNLFTNDITYLEAALEDMLDTRIMFQVAHRYGINITDRDIDEYLEQFMVDNSIESEEELAQWLEENHGVSDVELYRNALKQYQTYNELITMILQNPDPAMSISSPTEQQIREYFNEHIEDYRSEPVACISVIFIRMTREDRQDYTRYREIRSRTDNIVSLIRNGERSFQSLVEEFSDDATTRERGGELGCFPRDALAAENSLFAQVAFGELEAGEVSDKIETNEGYFIIRLNDFRQGEQIQLNDVRQEITQILMITKAEDKLMELIADFREDSEINIYLDEIYQE